MTLRLLRFLLGSASVLTVSAWAAAGPVTAQPAPASAPIAVDLGASSRVRYVAALAGEGEGFSTPRPAAPMDHSAMPGMDHAPQAPQSPHTGHGAAPPPAEATGMGGGAHPTAPDPHAGHGFAPSASPAGTAGGGNTQLAQAGHVDGTGTVNSVDVAGRKVNLSHHAIPAIGWPAMTMDFAVAPSVNLTSVKAGSRVTFMLERGGDGMYVINSLTPSTGGR
jgi:Cu/Ag efflux protein CusF